MAFLIDGILASEHLDSSGEILSIAGCDISSLHRGEGVVNFEHESKNPNQLLGRIIQAKKIFGPEDAENERMLYYWEKCKCPFIYILCELFDSDVCKHIDAIFEYSAKNKTPNSANVLGFSIEGSKLTKEGPVVKTCVGRKATLTVTPCNKSCIAEMVPQEESKSSSEDSIFKSEISHTIDLLVKSEELEKGWKQKAVGAGMLGLAAMGGMAPKAHAGNLSNELDSLMSQQREKMKNYHPQRVVADPEEKEMNTVSKPGSMNAISEARSIRNGFPAGDLPDSAYKKIKKTESLHKTISWSAGKQKDGAMHFSHPEHGTVTVHKQPTGEFHVKHNGAPAGLKGNKGTFSSAAEAGKHAKEYMGAVSSGKIAAPKMHDRPSPQIPKMTKALSAGSGMAAPGNLVQGAALGKESLEKVSQKLSKPNKSKNLMRAEQEYSNWSKREEFENFMAKTMPNLTKGEIKAIGQTLALHKSLKSEKKLAKMMTGSNISSYIQKSNKK